MEVLVCVFVAKLNCLDRLWEKVFRWNDDGLLHYIGL